MTSGDLGRTRSRLLRGHIADLITAILIVVVALPAAVLVAAHGWTAAALWVVLVLAASTIGLAQRRRDILRRGARAPTDPAVRERPELALDVAAIRAIHRRRGAARAAREVRAHAPWLTLDEIAALLERIRASESTDDVADREPRRTTPIGPQ